MNTLLITIVSLSAIGLVSAIILYFIAQKFKVEEDPRIDQVEELLPGANCGNCGFPGCRGLAEASVKSKDMEGIYCPVGGAETMKKVSAVLGKEVKLESPKVAVVRCNGSCDNRERTSVFDGPQSCAIQHSTYIGETDCVYGCLGCGDCVDVCEFDAIHMNTETGLPEVDEDKCVSCGACVKACPRNIIELRNKGPKNRRIFVSCVSQDKGGVARKACSAACIGCGKCVKECPFGAITLENNVAYIDFSKCRLCRKCVAVCPTGAIHEVNFPERKITQPKVNTEISTKAKLDNLKANVTSSKTEETSPKVNSKVTPKETPKTTLKAEKKTEITSEK